MTRSVLVLLLACAAAGGAIPSGAASLFGLCDTGELFASSDAGTSWSAVATLPVRDAVALAAVASAHDLRLVSASGSFYFSDDAGTTWIGIGAIPSHDVTDMAVARDGSIYVLTRSGSIHRSLDQGETFDARGTVPAFDCVSLAADGTGALHLLTRSGSVYESADAGASWIATAALPVADAARIRRHGTSLVVLTGSGDVAMRPQGETTWTLVGTLSQVGVQGLVSMGGLLFAATREGHVAASVDGAAWSWKGSINQLQTIALASDEPAITSVEDPAVARGFAVGVPWPNPARRDAVNVPVRWERPGTLEVSVHDVAGRRLIRRTASAAAAGDATIAFPISGLGQGVYWLRFSVDGRAVAGRTIVTLP